MDQNDELMENFEGSQVQADLMELIDKALVLIREREETIRLSLLEHLIDQLRFTQTQNKFEFQALRCQIQDLQDKHTKYQQIYIDQLQKALDMLEELQIKKAQRERDGQT